MTTRKSPASKLIQAEKDRRLERDVAKAVRAEQRERAEVERMKTDPVLHRMLTHAFRTPDWARTLVDEIELDERDLWELLEN